MKLDKIQMEVHKLNFNHQDSIDLLFTKSFNSLPLVTATSDNNINIFSESITTTGCTIKTSSKITGLVYIHILGIK